jgi:hypothetical protein
MKPIKTLNAVLAASLLTGATLAQAASYDVTGTLDSFSTNPSVISAIFNPEAPAFTGTWNIDLDAPLSATGDASFGAYVANWSVVGNPTGTTSYTFDNYSFGTFTGSSYNEVTRTLTLIGTLNNTSAEYTCSGSAFLCGNTLPVFDLTLSLTFTDDTLNSFSGNLVAVNGPVGGQYRYDWSFAGQAPEVPVPAAFWLFGSAVAGLAGLARSRKG